MAYLVSKCADDVRGYYQLLRSIRCEGGAPIDGDTDHRVWHGEKGADTQGRDAVNRTARIVLPVDALFRNTSRNTSFLNRNDILTRLDDEIKEGSLDDESKELLLEGVAKARGKGSQRPPLRSKRHDDEQLCPKSLQCFYDKRSGGVTKSIPDPCHDLPGYAKICMRTCELCKPSKIMPLIAFSAFTAVVLGAMLLCICCARRLLHARKTPHIEFHDDFGIGELDDGVVALVSQAEASNKSRVAEERASQGMLELEAPSQDGASALVERRAQMNELSARDTFSSASVIETFSMLTEDIFNRTKLYGIMKLGVYEHWIIKPDDVRLHDVDSPPVDRGTFGEVRRGWLYGGTDVAIKAAVCVNREQGLYTLANEMRLLRRIRHPNIVLFHGVLVDRERLSLSLVLEWVDGTNMERYVRESRDAESPDGNEKVVLSLSQRELKLLIDVVRGMQYLHAQVPVILHRDLKPANVLIETAIAPPRAKIADFGLSAVERSGGHNQRVGTPAYMAPEVQRSERYSTSADVYSFGCVLLFSLTSKHPRATLLPAVCTWAKGDDCPKDLVDAVKIARDCLQAAPSSRPPFSRLLQCLSEITAAENKRESSPARMGQGASCSSGQYKPPHAEAGTEVMPANSRNSLI